MDCTRLLILWQESANQIEKIYFFIDKKKGKKIAEKSFQFWKVGYCPHQFCKFRIKVLNYTKT